jgi:hypothetical protein
VAPAARPNVLGEDDGSGMDEDIIDNFLLVLFKSSKENDLTKIGKFGVGFLSVFAPKPFLVRVYTSKNMESWRLDFPNYRSYNPYYPYNCTCTATTISACKSSAK